MRNRAHDQINIRIFWRDGVVLMLEMLSCVPRFLSARSYQKKNITRMTPQSIYFRLDALLSGICAKTSSRNRFQNPIRKKKLMVIPIRFTVYSFQVKVVRSVWILSWTFDAAGEIINNS